MIYGYIRVSSCKQTVENQRFEISQFCNRKKLVVDGWIEESISGTQSYNKRKLGKLLRKALSVPRLSNMMILYTTARRLHAVLPANLE